MDEVSVGDGLGAQKNLENQDQIRPSSVFSWAVATALMVLCSQKTKEIDICAMAQIVEALIHNSARRQGR